MASASVKATLTVAIDSSDAAFNGTAGYGITATRPLTVVDFYVIAAATSANGVATLRGGTNAIFTGVACAVANDVARAAAGYNATNAAVAVGDSLNIIATGDAPGNVRGRAYVTVIPEPIT